MRLGINLGYWQRDPEDDTETVLAAERLGYDQVFTAEAYGSDAFTTLTWYGARTSRIGLGTAVTQMSARTPAATAMHALTLDALSGGRLTLGLGASGPQVVEGWYGVPFARPLARTREYVQILRDVWRRAAPVTSAGPHYPLPLPPGGPGVTGLGKPLKSIAHPVRPDIPVYLGAEGPKNVALAAEICDGWLALFFSPRNQDFYRDALAEGFAREGARHSWEDFEIAATVPVVLHDDVEQAADFLRPMYALYFGGMGARAANFHHDVAVRLGYEAEAKKVQDLYLEGKKQEAAAAIPTALVEDLALIGPEDKVRDDLEAWRESIATTLLVGGDAATLRRIADLVLG
jgi:F420-dependent oxidoreductase-like protein